MKFVCLNCGYISDDSVIVMPDGSYYPRCPVCDSHFGNKNKIEKINAREWAAVICDAVEDVLDMYDTYIPCEDRVGDDGEACLFGEPYDDLENKVKAILTELVKEVKQHPESDYDFYNY